MKKTYLNPAIDIVEIKTEQLMALGSLDPENNRGSVSDSFVESGTEAESRGGFWDDED